MLVFHSSNQCFTDPDIEHSREALDFGKGFYVTRLREQAEKYAKRFYGSEKMPVCIFLSILLTRN